MLKWLRRRNGPVSYLERERERQPQPTMSGKYRLLYDYLHNRYADTVVLTFGQIESLLGFSLPAQARLSQQWWTNAVATTAETNHSDAWTLASRIARPNLLAQTVAFERAA